MKIPKTFSMGGTTWKVEEVSRLDCCGITYRDEAVISLRKELPQQAKEQTFYHELFHVIKFTMGNLDAHDEKEVEAMAHMLHQFLKTAK